MTDLPVDHDVESGVLAQMYRHADIQDHDVEQLDHAVFALPDHRLVFLALRQCRVDGVPVC